MMGSVHIKCKDYLLCVKKSTTNNDFCECLHALSLSMFCDVRVYYRLLDVPVKAMYTASTHNILLESLLSDV